MYAEQMYNICLNYKRATGTLFDRNLFTEIRFPIGKVAEDEYTCYKVYLLSEKISFINANLYIYRRNLSGLSATSGTLNMLPLQDLEEQITLLTVLGYDTKDICKTYIERLGLRQKALLQSGDYDNYLREQSLITILKKHNIKI